MSAFPFLAVAIGFIAGFVDSIAGGGGLIALPGLLFLGLPPHLALGTNKFQSIFGTASAAITYIYNGQAQKAKIYFGIAVTFFFALLGSFAVLYLDPSWVRKLIPFILGAVFLYLVLRRKSFDHRRTPKLGVLSFYSLFGVIIGFYDGFFGPGTGSFWMMAFMAMLALPTLPALANTKVMNVASNAAAVIVFACLHKIDYQVGLTMAVAQVAGGNLGARLAIKKGARLVQPFLLVLVFLTILKTFYDSLLK